MAPLGKAGVLRIGHTMKLGNMAIAGYSEFRMRRIMPWERLAHDP